MEDQVLIRMSDIDESVTDDVRSLSVCVHRLPLIEKNVIVEFYVHSSNKNDPRN